MVHVVATIDLHPGARARFLEEFARLVPLVLQEPGCLEYGAATDVPSGLVAQIPTRPDTVVLIEKWSGVEALAAHALAPHMIAFRRRTASLIRESSVQVLQPEVPHPQAPFTPIGVARTPYTDTGQVPKGLGARHDAEGTLELRSELEEGLTDIEGFSHLFVIWVFHRAEGSALVGTPPCDDRPHGVFATRSPRRPNPIGLTLVRLLARQGPNLRVAGVDMLDGTPILDIKPCLSTVPPAELRRGWLEEAEARQEGRGSRADAESVESSRVE